MSGNYRSMEPNFIKLTSFLVGTKSFVTHQVGIITSGIPEIKTIITNQGYGRVHE